MHFLNVIQLFKSIFMQLSVEAKSNCKKYKIKKEVYTYTELAGREVTSVRLVRLGRITFSFCP